MLAPLSTRVQVSTAFKVCDGSISWTEICIDGVVFILIAAHFTLGKTYVEGVSQSKNP